ncbi:hypothetical protein [Sorangium sp. So ce542]|uniref:hypothetical protein n=1 Tax=Sorangium sp. So ce542 TaxID=3133316 RepID=UPI003F62C613
MIRVSPHLLPASRSRAAAAGPFPLSDRPPCGRAGRPGTAGGREIDVALAEGASVVQVGAGGSDRSARRERGARDGNAPRPCAAAAALLEATLRDARAARWPSAGRGIGAQAMHGALEKIAEVVRRVAR